MTFLDVFLAALCGGLIGLLVVVVFIGAIWATGAAAIGVLWLIGRTLDWFEERRYK